MMCLCTTSRSQIYELDHTDIDSEVETENIYIKSDFCLWLGSVLTSEQTKS